MSSYGAPPPPPLGSGYNQPMAGSTPPPNYLVWAILSTVLCCLPLGVASIVYAAQVNSKWYAGDAGRRPGLLHQGEEVRHLVGGRRGGRRGRVGALHRRARRDREQAPGCGSATVALRPAPESAAPAVDASVSAWAPRPRPC